MSRVPITVMGYHCDRCAHEWIPPGGNYDLEPEICPKCHSPSWNTPRKQGNSYEDFKTAIQNVMRATAKPLTWTEIRTTTGLSQLFPNNQWVYRLESDIGLRRQRDNRGIILWHLGENDLEPIQSASPPKRTRKRSENKSESVE